MIPRRKGLNHRALNPHQRATQYTQEIVNAMIRARDEGKPCVSCGKPRKLYAGHFRVSTYGRTRYHPMNLHGQCNDCNGYNGGRTFEYGKALDRMYGHGAADFLEVLSRPIEQWSTEELGTLRAAARRGAKVYEQMYYELRPHHRFMSSAFGQQ
jgi:hypothetical protein